MRLHRSMRLICCDLGIRIRRRSVIVGATEVIAAVGADQLAVVAGEAVAAGGADLAMMIDWLLGGAVRTRM